jgi:hypothetical protein
MQTLAHASTQANCPHLTPSRPPALPLKITEITKEKVEVGKLGENWGLVNDGGRQHKHEGGEAAATGGHVALEAKVDALMAEMKELKAMLAAMAAKA